ncbi:sulfatase-like hydrolase/transferase [Roseibium salinum]|nr:sulfatase-like hydrolase/transferase [Roseibium salinum]
MEDDLVATGQDPHDQRVQKLHLTEKGRRLYESTLPVMQARQRSLRRQFDAEELRVLFHGPRQAGRSGRINGVRIMTGRNLLVIMSDEHQARAMGCAGHPFVQTPNLDALAARGVRFADAYTPSPICVPARASFATGRYVHRTRLWDNATPYDGAIPGWGHALQGAGVPVESIGKLHYRSEEDPAGFDVEHIPMNVVGGHGMVWASIRKEDERVTQDSRMLGDYIGPGTSKYTEYDAEVTRRTGDWLSDRARSEDDRPWCLYVGLVAPHFPLIVPQEFYDLYPLDSLPPGQTPSPRRPSPAPLGREAERDDGLRGQVPRRSGASPRHGELLRPDVLARP